MTTPTTTTNNAMQCCKNMLYNKNKVGAFVIIVEANVFQGCRWTRNQRHRQELRRVQNKSVQNKSEEHKIKRSGDTKIDRILTFVVVKSKQFRLATTIAIATKKNAPTIEQTPHPSSLIFMYVCTYVRMYAQQASSQLAQHDSNWTGLSWRQKL